MKNVIIGTAGHVDHGKTSLIKALTGIDTDRLKEEKKRGITIELGFAHIDLPNGQKVGIVDVPGHEKFIKNMLAGAGGVDIAMLIIAADEGFMPQTEEHLGILSLLDISHGVVVLTKSDLVDEDWIEMMKEELSEKLKGCFLESAPIMPISSHTGAGLEELRNKLVEIYDEIEDKNTALPARIPVDRVFSVDGFGTVITGTLIEGSLNEGDDVMIYPEQKMTKVRNIQVHGKDVKTAFPGQRVAVNLASIKKTEVKRGDTIAKPDSMTNTRMIDVKLSILPECNRSINNASRLHFYHGTSDALAKAVLLDRDSLVAGESGFVQFRLSEEIAVKKGDRFVVRFYSPLETVGGGTIIDANPVKHKRFNDDSIKNLEIKEMGSIEDKLGTAILEASPSLTPLSDIASALSISEEDIDELVSSLMVDDLVVRVNEKVVVHTGYLQTILRELEALLTTHHKQFPLQIGIKKEELRSKLSIKADIPTTDKIIALVLKSFQTVSENNGRVHLTSFTVTYSDVQKRVRDGLVKLYDASPFAPPSPEDLLAKFQKEKAHFPHVHDALFADGYIIAIAPGINFRMCDYDIALNKLKEHFSSNSTITLAQFRDYLQTSRKYAMALLEFFDRRNITKKVGDERVLL